VPSIREESEILVNGAGLLVDSAILELKVIWRFDSAVCLSLGKLVGKGLVIRLIGWSSRLGSKGSSAPLALRD
jgi:hypothetical protein